MDENVEYRRNCEIAFTCKRCDHSFVKGDNYQGVGVVQCPDCLKVFISNYWNYFRHEWLDVISKALIILIIFKVNMFDKYVIPTSSMEPTLHGAGHYPEDGGDQVLVNKIYYKLFEPKNWEVVVFNPPDEKRLFIKRLIGLPNQKVQIINGDIYLNNKISQKPAIVEEELLYTLYDSSLKEGPLDHFSEFKNQEAWLAANHHWKFEKSMLESDGGRGKVKFNYPIDDRISSNKITNVQVQRGYTARGRNPDISNLKIDGGYDGSFNLVGDMAIDFELQFKKNGGIFNCEIQENNHRFRCQVDEDGRQLKLIINGKVIKKVDVNLSTGRWYRVFFKNVDDRLQIKFDDNKIDYKFTSNDYGHKTSTAELCFNSEGAHVSIKNIRVRRDIFYHCENSDYASYENGQITFNLKDDQYFFLGDNVGQSKDSRIWGFVKRAKILGKAMFVLWPIRVWPGDELPPKLPLLPHRTRTKIIK